MDAGDPTHFCAFSFASCGEIWEELARASVPFLEGLGETWGPASRWWGAGLDRKPLEIDLVAESESGDTVLLGEVKWASPRDAGRILKELEAKAERLPFVKGRRVVTALWLKSSGSGAAEGRVVTPRQVLEVLL